MTDREIMRAIVHQLNRIDRRVEALRGDTDGAVIDLGAALVDLGSTVDIWLGGEMLADECARPENCDCLECLAREVAS